ncbi:MAG: CHAT domain-containing protein [Caldilineaceae bacterium]|nr:CHAT domain-containing protein [Caldilineaceae bacterium]
MTDERNRLQEILLRLSAYLDASLDAEVGELKAFVRSLLEQLTDESVHLPTIQAQLLRQLRATPALAALVKGWLAVAAGEAAFPATRGPLPSKGLDPALESLSIDAAGDEPPSATAPTVTRYTDIAAPSQVQVQERFPLIVNLTVAPSTDSRDTQTVEAPLGAQIQCMITSTPGLTVLNKRMQPLTVMATDSQPVVFYLRATEAGEHQAQLDFWYDGQIIASSTLLIRALAAVVPLHSLHQAGPPIHKLQANALKPDLLMRISTLQNQLHFDLHFSEFDVRSIQGPQLRSNPEEYRYNLLKEIEALNNEWAADNAYVLNELTKIGQRLYRDLWPIELRRAYRHFRNQVRTIQLVSDEPWIPWELVKPYDDEDPTNFVDDDFLALRYDLARWFTPAPAPAPAIAIDSLACIAPADSGLPAAQQELTFLQQLATTRHLHDYTPEIANKVAVEALLRTPEPPIRLWHFACHGDFAANAPGQSPLLLAGSAAATRGTAEGNSRAVTLISTTNTSTSHIASRHQQLRPNYFVGPVTTRLKHDRPFVFLNACRVGSGGMGLTGVGGWAKVLVADCGVGALLAPLWTINDTYANEFAELFYGALAAPATTVATATRQTRLELRRRHPNDPLWLAYSLYAHPNARITLGGPP